MFNHARKQVITAERRQHFSLYAIDCIGKYVIYENYARKVFLARTARKKYLAYKGIVSVKLCAKWLNMRRGRRAFHVG